MSAARQVAVITGGSQGLGRALALVLAGRGWDLALAARTMETLTAAGREAASLSGKEPLLVACDVSREEDAMRLAQAVEERFGRADVLVNNAGVGDYRPMGEMEPAAMRRHFEVNVFGAWYLIKAMLPLLEQGGRGYVLNVGSVFGRIALAGTSAYAASKAALARLCQGLGKELKDTGVRVGLFEPGPMATNFQDGREQGAVSAPRALTLDPQRAAHAMAAMIRSRCKRRAVPWWMPALLRFKAALG